ncbi:hypothetical protein MGYG_00796 [Nannizzia gypsea CBS 118893]|uniref:Uncharacterized protein n=1 Tax=Arthroderma gypseum (strain ATCC MYA-4604 / CBS 118893) TaxID=535722 RepID=E5R1Q7_ARTGP|nr:hypothetical protein MGYG_00796 [Nannizzia gypsea CBS 118893]EFQ97755.1 hypothetical protein MGYG_00796 [Nannizzia gypsea CBS 118893]
MATMQSPEYSEELEILWRIRYKGFQGTVHGYRLNGVMSPGEIYRKNEGKDSLYILSRKDKIRKTPVLMLQDKRKGN